MAGWPLVRIIVVAATVAVALAGATGRAAAQAPVKPGQHFVGLVNGVQGRAEVYTVCPGPASGRRTGPVRRGQTMAVARAAGGHGYTGLFSEIYSWFQPVRPGTRPVMLRFSRYGEPAGIPASVRVPCTGDGEAVFSSCPYLAPCPAGWVPDAVKVRFVNVAAAPSASGAGSPALCARSAVRISAATDRRAFGPHQMVIMTSSVTNRSGKACDIWLGQDPGYSPSFVVTRPNGAVAWDRCWGADHPGRGCAMVLYQKTLAPGATYSQQAAWNQRYAPPGHTQARVPPGTYRFVTFYQYIGGAAAKFVLKPA